MISSAKLDFAGKEGCKSDVSGAWPKVNIVKVS